MRGLPILLSIILITGISGGFGYYDGMNRGTILDCIAPRAAATGGIWSLGLEPAMGAALNPASLVLADSAAIEAGLAPGSWETEQVYPFPLGNKHYNGLHLGGLSAGAVFPLTERWAVGIGAVKLTDYKFSGSTMEFETEEYTTTATRLLESSGSLFEVSSGAAYRATEWLSVGVAGGFRLGEGSWEESIDYYDQDTVYVNAESWKASELCLRSGLIAVMGDAIMGLAYSTKSDRMPDGMALGARMRFEALAMGEIGVEYETHPALSDSLVNMRAFLAVKGIYPGVTSYYSITCREERQQSSSTLGGSVGLELPIPPVSLIGSVAWNGSDRHGYVFGNQFFDREESSRTTFSAGVLADL